MSAEVALQQHNDHISMNEQQQQQHGDGVQEEMEVRATFVARLESTIRLRSFTRYIQLS
jgi:hypothetical protein